MNITDLILDIDYIYEFVRRTDIVKRIATFHQTEELLQRDLRTYHHLCKKYDIDLDAPTYNLAAKMLDEKDYLGYKTERMYNCGQSWFFDFYKMQTINDLTSINFCMDLMCPLCQKMKQRTRMVRFMPTIMDMVKSFDLYHIALTKPNTDAGNLSASLTNLTKACGKLNLLMSNQKGSNKLRQLLSQYGYAGMLRSVEITFNKDNRGKGEEYHDHLHLIVALRKGLTFDPIHENKFSSSAKNGYRLFNDFEILIQKMWKLTIDNQEVTISAINDLELGYSCTVDKIDLATSAPHQSEITDCEGNTKGLYEVFKYATKAFNDNGEILDYEQIKVLRNALKGRRQVQGSGVFHHLTCDDSVTDQEVAIYKTLIQKLKQVELPEKTSKRLKDVIYDMADPTSRNRYITGKAIHHLEKSNLFDLIKPADEAAYFDTLRKIELEREQRNHEKELAKKLRNQMSQVKRHAEKHNITSRLEVLEYIKHNCPELYAKTTRKEIKSNPVPF